MSITTMRIFPSTIPLLMTLALWLCFPSMVRVHMIKIDLKVAFCMIHKWVHLGISWQRQSYVDTCHPLGLNSAQALFNNYSNALRWIMASNYGALLLHYLDDLLSPGWPSWQGHLEVGHVQDVQPDGQTALQMLCLINYPLQPVVQHL